MIPPLKTFRLFLCLGISFLLLFFISFPFLLFSLQKKQIYSSISTVHSSPVGIVFGAGLKPNGTPSDVLEDRLRVAATLFKEGKIRHILVSGDNRFMSYNEPQAMADELITNFNIPKSVIAKDFAGRRTYDTCMRAKTIWGVDNAILISQGFHLPRAIWTCNALGITSTGYSATLQPYQRQFQFKVREILAIYRTFIDLYLIPPSYVHGEPETQFSSMNPVSFL